MPLLTKVVLEKPAPAGSDEGAATTSTKVAELPEAIAADAVSVMVRPDWAKANGSASSGASLGRR